MKKLIDLNDLMVDQLNELYNGNKLLLKSLSDVELSITDKTLKNVVLEEVKSLKGQIQYLKRAFDMIYVHQTKNTAYVFDALVQRLKDLIRNSADSEVKDAAIVTALQHINHYKVAGYGAICTYAKMLDLYPLASLIHQNLEQEKKMDKQLAMRAEEVINQKAQIGSL